MPKLVPIFFRRQRTQIPRSPPPRLHRCISAGSDVTSICVTRWIPSPAGFRASPLCPVIVPLLEFGYEDTACGRSFKGMLSSLSFCSLTSIHCLLADVGLYEDRILPLLVPALRTFELFFVVSWKTRCLGMMCCRKRGVTRRHWVMRPQVISAYLDVSVWSGPDFDVWVELTSRDRLGAEQMLHLAG